MNDHEKGRKAILLSGNRLKAWCEAQRTIAKEERKFIVKKLVECARKKRETK